ncbi:MAG TPA: hypothetical protein VGI39_34645 [Polyangiaceae bacterium]|jgi:hypothetical protein
MGDGTLRQAPKTRARIHRLARSFAALAPLAALFATACEPATPPRAPIETAGPLRQDFDPISISPSIGLDEIHDDDPTIQTSNDDELLHFVERRLESDVVRGGRLSAHNRELLLTPPEPGRTVFTRFWHGRGHNVVFSLRTPRDVRAIVVPRTISDRLVPSVAWMSLVFDVEGPSAADKAAWYREIARRVASGGRATGLVRFSNGNAIAVIVALEPTPADDSDVQLVALSRPLQAGTYAGQDWGPQIVGEGLSVKKMNGHEGVSIKDILRQMGRPAGVASAAPGSAPTESSPQPVIPGDPAILGRVCGTYCRRLAECQPGAGVPQCEENCRERNPSKLRPYYRQDYVDAAVQCTATASCDVLLDSSNPQCSAALRPPPSDSVHRLCTWMSKQIFDCSGRTDGESVCFKAWGLVRDDVAEELLRRCANAPCATRVHCLNSSVGLPK